jgi:hypothetical protein
MSQAPTKRPQPPSFKGQIITLAFPVLGIDVSCALEKQTPMTTAFGTNVRGWEPASGRNRGGARPGLSQYIPQQLPGGASEVQMLQVVVDPQAIALPFVSGPLADPNGAIYGDGTPITYPTQGTGFQQENVNINPAKITITANNQSIIFGSALELEGTEFSVSGSLGILDKVTSVQFAINLVPVGLGQPLVVNVPLGVPYVPPTTLLLPANSGLTYQLIPHNAVVTGPAGGKATYNISYNNGGLTVQGLISFTTQPSNLSVGSNGSASVLVTDDSDNPLEGVSVAISLLNQKTGILTGTLTATTDDTGTAAFTNWQVTKSGTYQLVAQFNVSLPPNWPYDGPTATSLPFAATGNIQWVQDSSTGSFGSVTKGNLLVVILLDEEAFDDGGWVSFPPNGYPDGFTDSLGNEYIQASLSVITGVTSSGDLYANSVSIWYCISVASGFLELGLPNPNSWFQWEFSGVNQLSPSDNSGNQSQYVYDGGGPDPATMAIDLKCPVSESGGLVIFESGTWEGLVPTPPLVPIDGYGFAFVFNGPGDCEFIDSALEGEAWYVAAAASFKPA